MLSGCSSAVEVSVPGGGTTTACPSAEWARSLAGGARPDTPPAEPDVAAWGDPAIVARCGVAALAPTATECVEVDGVGWVPAPLSDGTRFTTFGTDPALEVLVPSTYDPAPLLLPAFDAVAKTLPRNDLRCR